MSIVSNVKTQGFKKVFLRSQTYFSIFEKNVIF